MSQYRILVTTIYVLLTGVLGIASVTTHAVVLEEIVVTAQKREQSIQDVGISITAFNAEQIKRLGFTGTQEIDQQTPGLMVTDYGNGVTTVFTVRGSSQLDFADHQEAPVAVYLDGAYNSYLSGVGFMFYDLERIETLRGPQGTLFGRNATGGLVHLITAKPTREFEGYGELSGGEYGKIRFEGALSGPLTDAVSGRLSLLFDNDDGFVDNRLGDDLLDTDNKSGRAQLLFEPNDDVSLLVSGRWAIDDINGQGYSVTQAVTSADGLVRLSNSGPAYQSFCENVVVFGPTTPATLPPRADCLGLIEPDDGIHKVGIDEVGYFEREHYGITATLNWNLGNFRIVSITDWQDLTKRYREDTDGTANTLFNFLQDMDSNQISEELRVHWETDQSRWVAGAYYLNIDGNFDVGGEFPAFGFDTDNHQELETETYAFFLQGEYDITPEWTAIAGIRWTEDEKDYVFDAGCSGIIIPDFGSICGFFAGLVQGDGVPPTSRSEGEYSATFELDWHPNEDWLVYGKVTRGNKAGGFNGGSFGNFLVSEAEYDGEVLTSYEGGFKATLFNGTTRLNSTIFYYDYEDFQTFTQLGVTIFVFNVDAEVLGGEIELITNPWEGWEFMFGVSLLDADQKDLEYAGVTRDRPLPNAPEVSFNGLGRYEWPMFGGSMAAQLDFNYVDERSLNTIDHPALIADSYFVLNGKLSYTTADGRWQADLWVKNLNDEDYIQTGFDTSTASGLNIEVAAPPRWFGGTITYRWN